MGELRKDYILDRWVLISAKRGNRPHQFEEEKAAAPQKCFFCPGNEDMTPPEIGRREKDGKWYLRWFPNKFGAVKAEGQKEIKTDNTYFTFSSAYGAHEVLVETANDDEQLWDLDEKQITEVLEVYQERIDDLSKKEGIKYVVIFKNSGPKAGTSVLHSHSQIVGLNHIPLNIREILTAVKRSDHCPYCDIVQVEKQSDRRCFENDSFVAFTPYASRFNYELAILPKQHAKSLAEVDLYQLADILKQVFVKLKQMSVSYNIFLLYPPEDEDFHLQIVIAPRIANWAGFEFTSGVIINSVTPEDAAAFYRGEQ